MSWFKLKQKEDAKVPVTEPAEAEANKKSVLSIEDYYSNLAMVPEIDFSKPNKESLDSPCSVSENIDESSDICDIPEDKAVSCTEGDDISVHDTEYDICAESEGYYNSIEHSEEEDNSMDTVLKEPEDAEASNEENVEIPPVKEELYEEKDYAGRFYREQILAQKRGRKEMILYMVCGVITVALLCVCIVLASVLSSLVISKQQNEFVATVLNSDKKNSTAASPVKTNAVQTVSEDTAANQSDLNGMYLRGAASDSKKYMERMGIKDIRELIKFDSFAAEAVEKTNHPVLMSIFSPSEDASMEDIADTYKIWSYIMTVRQNKMDISTAFLEAASLVKYSKDNKIPLSLSVGVAQTESRFNISAMSNKNALGPMQVVYNIHKGLLTRVGIVKKEELFTADKGVMAGCYLLGRYVQSESNITGGLKKYYGVLSPKYISSVLNHRHAYELFASGMTDNPALAISREEINWAKMSAPQVPVYKKPAQPQVKISGAVPVNNTNSSTIVYKNTGYIIKKDENGKLQKIEFTEDRQQ